MDGWSPPGFVASPGSRSGGVVRGGGGGAALIEPACDPDPPPDPCRYRLQFSTALPSCMSHSDPAPGANDPRTAVGHHRGRGRVPTYGVSKWFGPTAYSAPPPPRPPRSFPQPPPPISPRRWRGSAHHPGRPPLPWVPRSRPLRRRSPPSPLPDLTASVLGPESSSRKVRSHHSHRGPLIRPVLWVFYPPHCAH